MSLNNTKVNSSRKSTTSIMCNPHFEGITLKKENVSMYVPPEWIFTDGRIKGYAINKWNKKLKDATKTRQAI